MHWIPQSYPNPNLKRSSSNGTLEIVAPSVALWNSAWQRNVPRAVPWIGSLPSQAFKSPRIDGVTWKPVMIWLKKASDGLTKCMQDRSAWYMFWNQKWNWRSIKPKIDRGLNSAKMLLVQIWKS